MLLYVKERQFRPKTKQRNALLKSKVYNELRPHHQKLQRLEHGKNQLRGQTSYCLHQEQKTRERRRLRHTEQNLCQLLLEGFHHRLKR